MKSPFPGMDPYLESHWRDVHSSLIIYTRDQMQTYLPEDLFARVEERVYVENEEGELRNIAPDVRVVEHGRGGGVAVLVQGEVETADSFIIQVRNEPATEKFIEIREVGSDNRVITVIEFISPTNKTKGEGFDLYRQKQKELWAAGVSLVEVDLLRSGKRVLSVPLKEIPVKKRTPCQAIARRGWDWIHAEVFPLPLRTPLPAVRVPLRQTDRAIMLKLQPLVDQCYQNGRYHTIDYQIDPDPPFTGDDIKWADDLLRAAGKRK